MKRDKARIANVFRQVKYREGIVCFLMGLGFQRTKDGIRKLVFISPRHDFVVKLARSGNFQDPTKGSIIGRFYLWPEKGGVRKFRGCRWHLTFQPKGDVRGQRKTFARLEEALFNANTAWRFDAHSGNVALYRGKPVIIDY